MIKIRKSGQRGRTEIGWLDSRHSFSFGDFYDQGQMGFGALRVINEDRVTPGRGFGTHSHRDMEILSYVLEGKISHKDSLGTGSVIVPGEVQRMTAGTGISHSEQNPQADLPLHFLQIWIIPAKNGLKPGYEQKDFSKKRAPGTLTLVGSQDGREGSLTVHQDASIFVLDLEAGRSLSVPVATGRVTWVQVARGSAFLNGQRLEQGDGAGITDEKSLNFKTDGTAELLLFDLAG